MDNKSRQFFNIIGFIGGGWMIFEGYQHYRAGVEFFGIHTGGIGLMVLGILFCLLNVFLFYWNR